MSAVGNLSPEDRAIKRAFRAAVLAAGGQVYVGKEIGRSQSRISDYGNSNHPDMPPADVVRDVEALGVGAPGHPHVTRALARQADGHFVSDGGRVALDRTRLGEHLAMVTRENADLVVALAEEDLDAVCADLSPNARARLGIEVEQLMGVTRRLLAAIDGCGEEKSVPVRLVNEADEPDARRRRNDTS